VWVSQFFGVNNNVGGEISGWVAPGKVVDLAELSQKHQRKGIGEKEATNKKVR